MARVYSHCGVLALASHYYSMSMPSYYIHVRFSTPIRPSTSLPTTLINPLLFYGLVRLVFSLAVDISSKSQFCQFLTSGLRDLAFNHRRLLEYSDPYNITCCRIWSSLWRNQNAKYIQGLLHKIATGCITSPGFSPLNDFDSYDSQSLDSCNWATFRQSKSIFISGQCGPGTALKNDV
jgi:hypothetical protein